ncbi:MAG TPA: ComF family protein [Candidatus Paceibacterota bacterium]|nr:ComF family protein [Candidatus Paceibacterota bacterium]
MKLHLTDVLASILFPRRCLGCGKSAACGAGAGFGAGNGTVLCETCRGQVTIARTLFCGACGERLFGGKALCHPDFPYVLGAAAQYDNRPLRALVHALKFRAARRAAEPLASIIKEYLASVGSLFDGFHDFVVIPIPLSRRRLRTRGFNQAELLARPVAAYLGLPCDGSTLIRIRHTKPQTETKSAHERQENLRECFFVRRPLAGTNIILIDDVTTTGTTFLEAATALKRAGVGTVVALAALRA